MPVLDHYKHVYWAPCIHDLVNAINWAIIDLMTLSMTFDVNSHKMKGRDVNFKVKDKVASVSQKVIIILCTLLCVFWCHPNITNLMPSNVLKNNDGHFPS